MAGVVMLLFLGVAVAGSGQQPSGRAEWAGAYIDATRALSEKKFDIAEQKLNLAVKIAEAEGSAGWERRAMAWNSLGVVYRQTKRLDEARRVYALALGELEAHCGKMNPELSPVLVNLASLEREKGDLNQALALLARLISIEESSSAPSASSLSLALYHQGEIYRHQKRYPEAEKSLTRCLDIREARKAHELEIGQTVRALAAVYRADGRPDRAAALEDRLRHPGRSSK